MENQQDLTKKFQDFYLPSESVGPPSEHAHRHPTTAYEAALNLRDSGNAIGKAAAEAILTWSNDKVDSAEYFIVGFHTADGGTPNLNVTMGLNGQTYEKQGLINPAVNWITNGPQKYVEAIDVCTRSGFVIRWLQNWHANATIGWAMQFC